MIDEQINENYGYFLPLQLRNPTWKKCLENQTLNQELILQGIVNIRKYLSHKTEVQHLINTVIQSQVQKPLLRYGKKLMASLLKQGENQLKIKTLYEILWIFTNLCSGNKYTTIEMIDMGIVKFTKDLFVLEKYTQIMSILFEVIGNLAGQLSARIKIEFLGDPSFYHFIDSKFINYEQSPEFLKNASWAFSNMFRDLNECNDKISLSVYQDMVLGYYPLIEALLDIKNQQCCQNLLFIFHQISKDGTFHMKQTFDIVQKFLKDPRKQIRRISTKIIGNYIAKNEQAVEWALDLNNHYLQTVFDFFRLKDDHKLRKESAWALSNIFAGTIDQVQKAVQIPGLLSLIHQIISEEENQDVVRQFFWSISNSFSSCSEKAFQIIFSSSIIQPLSEKLLVCSEIIGCMVYLETVSHYLRKIQLNPNLDWALFLRNLTFIEPALMFIYKKHSGDSVLINNIQSINHRIKALLERGPITQQQMTKKYLQSFCI